MADALTVITGIFTKAGIPDISFAMFTDLCLAASALLLMFVKEVSDEYNHRIQIAESRHWLVRHAYIVAMIAIVILFGVLGGDQFIYFQF